MKTLLRLLLSIALLTGISLPALGAEAGGIPSSWAQEEVERALDYQFVPLELQSGYQDNISRADFVYLAMCFLTIQYHYQVDRPPLALNKQYLVRRCASDYLTMHTTDGQPTFHKSDWADCVSLPVHVPGHTIEDESWITILNYMSLFSDVRCLEEPNLSASLPDLELEQAAMINAAALLGLIEGRGNGIFDPHGSLTRQEAAAILLRLYRLYAGEAAGDPIPPEVNDSFSDCREIAPWAAEAVSWAVSQGVMYGTDGGRFDPLGCYTREQCIVSLLRLMEEGEVSILKGNVEPMCTYEQQLDLVYREAYYTVHLRLETEHATVIYGSYGGMSRPSDGWPYFFLVYRDGGPSWRVGAPSNNAIETYSLSKDGDTLFFTFPDDKHYQLEIMTGKLTELSASSLTDRSAQTADLQGNLA